MAFSKKRLDKVLKGEVTYQVTVDGSVMYQSFDFMAAVRQFDSLRKEHPDQDVQIKIMEA